MYGSERPSLYVLFEKSLRPSCVLPPNNALQRTRRQSLRSFLLAAELDIVGGQDVQKGLR